MPPKRTKSRRTKRKTKTATKTSRKASGPSKLKLNKADYECKLFNVINKYSPNETIRDPHTQKKMISYDRTKMQLRCNSNTQHDDTNSKYFLDPLKDKINDVVKEFRKLNNRTVNEILSNKNIQCKEIDLTQKVRMQYTNCDSEDVTKEIQAVATSMISNVLMKNQDGRLYFLKTVIETFNHLYNEMHDNMFTIVLKGGNVNRMQGMEFATQLHSKLEDMLNQDESWKNDNSISDFDFEVLYLGNRNADNSYAIRRRARCHLMSYVVMMLLLVYIQRHLLIMLPDIHMVNNYQNTIQSIMKKNGQVDFIDEGTFFERVNQISDTNALNTHCSSDCERNFQDYFDAITDKKNHYYNATILFVGFENPYPNIFKHRSNDKIYRKDFVKIFDEDANERLYIETPQNIMTQLGFHSNSTVQKIVERSSEINHMYCSFNTRITDDKVDFMLCRIKMTFVICYRTNKGRYLCDSVVGELLDLSGSLPNNSSWKHQENQDYIIEKVIPYDTTPIRKIDGKGSITVKTNTWKYVVLDLQRMVFLETDYKPWLASKPLKRLRRFIWACTIYSIENTFRNKAQEIVYDTYTNLFNTIVDTNIKVVDLKEDERLQLIPSVRQLIARNSKRELKQVQTAIDQIYDIMTMVYGIFSANESQKFLLNSVHTPSSAFS